VILDSINYESNRSTSSEGHTPSASSFAYHLNTNINSSLSNISNSNETDSDINMSIQPSPLETNVGAKNLVSKVWLYAKKSDNGEQAACQLCDFTCLCHSHSTSTIRQHLIAKHNKTALILKSSRASSQIMISQALKQELHELCYAAIIKDSRPSNDLNKRGITALINKLCPGYIPPHRNQVVRHLKLLYNHHYYLLKEELKEVYRLSITLDFWSIRKSESFLCITGHWTTNSFDPISKIIDFSSFNTRHTAIEIAKVLKEKLIALNIYEKFLCITTDSAPNIVLACELLNDEIFRFWC
ncbi:unnamed protein product, partial [Rotaria sp. Silwood2]